MNIDLENMLRQASYCVPRDSDYGGYRHALPELGRNICELKRRWIAGDTTVIDEFFRLYHVDENRETP